MNNSVRTFAVAAGVALALGTLSACSPSPSPTPTSNKSSTSEAKTTGSASLPEVPTGKGIITAAKMTSCDTTGAEVTAKGTLTMPEGESGDAVISVSWVDRKTSTVYTRGVTTLKSPAPGTAVDWQTSATLPAGAESVSCVLGAVVPK
ncbi:hypothetical protein [Leifsonia sp. NPDC077715]|uniref:hypothetical protein n=1 Tax=Leifsonia sp. NPDC077715 TaxID=3155539 RepID=UPI0034462238